MNDNLQQLRDLITRIVTGDGQQMENLTMSDEEHQAELSPEGEEYIDVTIHIHDWLEMVRIARDSTGVHLQARDEGRGDGG